MLQEEKKRLKQAKKEHYYAVMYRGKRLWIPNHDLIRLESYDEMVHVLTPHNTYQVVYDLGAVIEKIGCRAAFVRVAKSFAIRADMLGRFDSATSYLHTKDGYAPVLIERAYRVPLIRLLQHRKLHPTTWWQLRPLVGMPKSQTDFLLKCQLAADRTKPANEKTHYGFPVRTIFHIRAASKLEESGFLRIETIAGRRYAIANPITTEEQ